MVPKYLNWFNKGWSNNRKCASFLCLTILKCQSSTCFCKYNWNDPYVLRKILNQNLCLATLIWLNKGWLNKGISLRSFSVHMDHFNYTYRSKYCSDILIWLNKENLHLFRCLTTLCLTNLDILGTTLNILAKSRRVNGPRYS